MNRKRTNIGSLARRLLSNAPYAIFLLLVLVLGACRDSGGPASPNEPNETSVAESLQPSEISLFDGKTMGQWAITDFGGRATSM